MGTLDSQEMQVDLAGDNGDFSVADIVAWVILYTLSYYFI